MCLASYRLTCPLETDASIEPTKMRFSDKMGGIMPVYTTTGVCIPHKGLVKDTIPGSSERCLDAPDIVAGLKDTYIYLWSTESQRPLALVSTMWAKITTKDANVPLLYMEDRWSLVWGPAEPGVAYQGCIRTLPKVNTVLHIRLAGPKEDF